LQLSIIIVNYNVREFLANLFDTLYKAIEGIEAEIIVVDNASADGSQEYIKQNHPGVILIENQVNGGFSKANNLGLKRAKGKFLLLLNPDTLVREDTFRVMMEYMESDSSIGMAGCKILNPDGTLQLACRRSFPSPWVSFCRITGLSSIFPKSPLFARYNLTYLDENQSYEVDAISGSFMMVKREVYEKMGGLDESYFMYGEDLDWCLRVQKTGYKVHYVHSTQIIHYKGESTKRSSIDETRHFYNAMHLFVKKNLSGSFLVKLMLRFAIGLRESMAYASARKTIILSVILDTVFYNLSLYLAEHTYILSERFRGFPDFALPVVYTIPVIIHLLTSSVMRVYRRDRISVLPVLAATVFSFAFLPILQLVFQILNNFLPSISAFVFLILFSQEYPDQARHSDFLHNINSTFAHPLFPPKTRDLLCRVYQRKVLQDNHFQMVLQNFSCPAKPPEPASVSCKAPLYCSGKAPG